MKREAKKQLFLTIIAALFLVAALGVSWWAMRGLLQKRSDTQAVLQKLASVEANRAALQESRNEFEQVKKDITALNKNFYDTQTIPLFLSGLESEAHTDNVSFEITSANVVPGDTSTDKQLEVEFQAKSSYANLLHFSEALANQPVQIIFEKYYLLGAQPEQTGGVLPAKQKTASKASDWQLYATIHLVTFK